MTNELLEEINKGVAEINEIREELMNKLRPKFQDIFTSVFDNYPMVEKLQWQQYTPYFNDGEECIFRVNDLCVILDEDLMDDDWYYESAFPLYDSMIRRYGTDEESEWDKERWSNLIKAFGSYEKVIEFNEFFAGVSSSFEGIPDDMMKQLFGDHAQVTVTKDAITVDEYDHD